MRLLTEDGREGDATTVEIREGDVLVLSCAFDLHVSERHDLREMAEAAFPGTRCVVLSGGFDLSVVRKEALADA